LSQAAPSIETAGAVVTLIAAVVLLISIGHFDIDLEPAVPKDAGADRGLEVAVVALTEAGHAAVVCSFAVIWRTAAIGMIEPGEIRFEVSIAIEDIEQPD
jgi:hypothetical protein